MTQENALKKLRISSLRPWQVDPLKAILSGEDVFVSAPTGGGKSLLFQLPAVMEEELSLTLVISPLRALQEDQVLRLKSLSIAAELLNSDLSPKARREILDALPQTRLLYLAPEQLDNKDLLAALGRCRVARLAIDEAHVLPQAMVSFRKAYGQIDQFLDNLPIRPQIIACTATARPKIRKTICKELGMLNPKTFTLAVRRRNLHLVIKKIDADKERSAHANILNAVERSLKKWKKRRSKKKRGAVIIYVPTVKGVKSIYKWLKARHWKAAKYTGKMSEKKRREAMAAFLSGKAPIMVATNAFGMGIDKSNVRLVIHAGLPLSMDGYIQEIGRAGRDGKRSKCLLLYSKSDYVRNASLLKCFCGKKAARQAIRDLDALWNFTKSTQCLWKEIERRMGEKPGKRCKTCCHCRK